MRAQTVRKTTPPHITPALQAQTTEEMAIRTSTKMMMPENTARAKCLVAISTGTTGAETTSFAFIWPVTDADTPQAKGCHGHSDDHSRHVGTTPENMGIEKPRVRCRSGSCDLTRKMHFRWAQGEQTRAKGKKKKGFGPANSARRMRSIRKLWCVQEESRSRKQREAGCTRGSEGKKWVEQVRQRCRVERHRL